MARRFRRLIETFIAKKYVAWGVGCYFLQAGKITGNDWWLLTSAIFVLDLATKIKAPVTEVASA